MRNIFLLLHRFKDLFVYLFACLISVILMVNFNHVHRSSWLHSSNAVTGNINQTTSSISNYFGLRKTNNALADANASLLEKIKYLELENQRLNHSQTVLQEPKTSDSLSTQDSMSVKKLNPNYVFKNDSIHQFIPALVTKITTNSNTNFISLDKGLKDGIRIDDGVVTENGIVGRVVSVEQHFCLVKSILHTNNEISIVLKTQKELGTLFWKGNEINTVEIKDISRHTTINKGDSVLTSGYGLVYPPNHYIGKISEVNLTESSAFYELRSELSVNFNQLRHVYIYKNALIKELRHLDAQTDTLP